MDHEDESISVSSPVKLFAVAPKHFSTLPLALRRRTVKQQVAVVESNTMIYFLCSGNKIKRIGLTGNLRNRIAQYKSTGFQSPSGKEIEFSIIDSVFFCSNKC